MTKIIHVKQRALLKADMLWQKLAARAPSLAACLTLLLTSFNTVVLCEAGDANANTGDSASTTAFNAIFNVLKTITTVVGAIFLIVGIVRFIIAHANEDGPNQQKAAMLIATGIALIIIGPVLSSIIKVDQFVKLPTVSN